MAGHSVQTLDKMSPTSGRWCEVLGVHDNALFRADLDAIAADDAGVRVQGPGLRVTGY